LCGRCRQPGHTANECTAPKPMSSSSERDWNKTKQVEFQEEKNVAKNVNHIAKDTSYFVTRSGKKTQNIIENGTSNSEVEIQVELPQTIKDNPPISIPGPIPSMEVPVEPSVETVLKPVEEMQPIANPILLPKTMTRNPIKVIPNKRKHTRTMRLAMGMQPYDVLANLDHIQPTISMRQLLAISPKCRSELSYSLIRKRSKEINVHDISIDPGAPTVDVMIDGSLIQGVQIDGGSSVNLMNQETMDEIGLTNMISTPIILRMADQSKVKPLGVLKQVPTLVGGIEYKVDYIIFKITESISSYPILLGRPWLYLAKAKDDWGKGTLTIGKGSQKTSLPMYPPIYRGETQEEDTNVTSDNSYDSDSEREIYEPIKQVASNSKSYQCLGLGEYFTPLIDPNDSDDAILAWQQSEVYNISIQEDSEPEPELESDSKELEDFLMNDDPTPLTMGTLKIAYKEMNLGTDQDPKNINVYEGLSSEEFTTWHKFFKDNKSAFAWTYKDLKGVPPDICEHQIILEDNVKPIRQRPYRLNQGCHADVFGRTDGRTIGRWPRGRPRLGRTVASFLKLPGVKLPRPRGRACVRADANMSART
jgi:hypothetical protein